MTQTGGKKVPGWRQPWDTWRLTMMGGAVVLLGAALARGLLDLPRAVEIALQAIGYVALAVGFGMAMRVRKELQDKRKKEADEKARERQRQTGLR
ncbi:MAG: hypothetical protein ACRDKT_08285 [Actinomycetota bacterium]